jgi:hypothetical protein
MAFVIHTFFHVKVDDVDVLLNMLLRLSKVLGMCIQSNM